ncbi:MAG TPA: acetate/propionate family kinase [Steroidobacteraceae bacterium]|nr:acetate/propionate family kinase [Steroidobacteraceae bacterium]
MSDAIVVLNAGSSSIKFSVFLCSGDNLSLYLRGIVESLNDSPRFVAKDAAGAVIADWPISSPDQKGHAGGVRHLVQFLRSQAGGHRLAAVGHRIVHGGIRFTEPVRIDAAVVQELEQLVPLAPLHQPHNLAPIRTLLERAPQVPQVACFDTSFHRTNPQIAQLFALPLEFAEAGLRRYGFHGLSYEYIASVLPRYDARAAAGRTVVMHLGNGSSMCALKAGQSITSTMGFTAIDGLPMGTRCGSMDPGAVLFLARLRGLDASAIEELIYYHAGLLGVSGISADMRTLLASSDPRAALAIDLYVYRIGRELGSLAAALGGLDAIVFTAGIGENAAALRERVCRDAAWMGVTLDESANAANGPRITTDSSAVAAWVIPTNEELMIANHTRRLALSVS